MEIQMEMEIEMEKAIEMAVENRRATTTNHSWRVDSTRRESSHMSISKHLNQM